MPIFFQGYGDEMLHKVEVPYLDKRKALSRER
jgi:hypothetical protein